MNALMPLLSLAQPVVEIKINALYMALNQQYVYFYGLLPYNYLRKESFGMDMVKTGKFIAKCRKDAELTQAALAEKLGITDRAVSKWETGKSLPDVSIMSELCGILGISVNELLTGEKINMDNYKEIAEQNLAELTRLEKDKNEKLAKAEKFIGWSGVVISLVLIICGGLIAENNSIVSIILIYFGGLIMLVDAIYGTVLEHDSGYYECRNCKHRHIPSTKAVILSVHSGSDRILRCPECSKKGWHTKVLTK